MRARLYTYMGGEAKETKLHQSMVYCANERWTENIPFKLRFTDFWISALFGHTKCGTWYNTQILVYIDFQLQFIHETEIRTNAIHIICYIIIICGTEILGLVALTHKCMNIYFQGFDWIRSCCSAPYSLFVVDNNIEYVWVSVIREYVRNDIAVCEMKAADYRLQFNRYVLCTRSFCELNFFMSLTRNSAFYTQTSQCQWNIMCLKCQICLLSGSIFCILFSYSS